jgi:hypothetical protein
LKICIEAVENICSVQAREREHMIVCAYTAKREKERFEKQSSRSVDESTS